MVKHFLTILAIITLAVSVSWSQEGVIRGSVNDKETGEALMFTNVMIKQSDPPIGTQTDLDGNYELEVQPGTYDLEVTYVGYAPKTITDVKVESNEVTVLDFNMEEEGVQLEEIVVQAKRLDRTENAVLAIQKKALGIQDGISAQEMSRFGSSNAAESMKRVTGASVVGGKYIFVRGLGDRYTSAQLNGQQLPSTDPYRNSMQMDLIPANLLDNIIASKTFTPDQPGNFTGGNVDMKTKNFPERFTLSASVSTSYNTQASLIDNFLTQDGGKTDWLGYDDGHRALPDILQDPNVLEELTPSANISARRDDDLAALLENAAESLNKQKEPTRKSSKLNHGASFSVGNRYTIGENPLGVLFGFNYSRNYSFYDQGRFELWELTDRNADSLNILRNLNETNGTESPNLGGLLNLAYKIGSSNKVAFNMLYNHNANKISRSFAGPFPGIISGNSIFETRSIQFVEREVQSYQLSGEHIIGKQEIKVEWKGSMVNTKQDEPDFRQFSNTFQIEDEGDTTYFISPAEFDLPWHFFRNLEDEQVLGKVDVTIPFAQSGSKANKLKFGVFYSDKDRLFTDNAFQFQIPTKADRYTGDPVSFFSDSNTGWIGTDTLPNGTTRNIIGLYPIQFQKITNENSYTGFERITAGYGMGVYDIGQMRFIGGLRVEKTEIEVASQAENLEEGKIDETDILPSLNLVYRVSEDMNIRASFSQTLARPNMRELAPFVSFDFGGDDRRQGNPELDRTKIQNYDLRWEMYPRPGELLAISAYFKKFDDPIGTAYVPTSANPLIEWINVPDANVFGAEFELRKTLDFISPILTNFKFSTNISLIRSEMDIPGHPDSLNTEQGQIAQFNPEKGTTRPFPGQSNILINAGLNYVNPDAGIDAMISYNYFGDRLSDIQPGKNPDVFERGRSQLDFSISKTLTDRLSLKFSARNILNPDFERFMTFKGTDYLISSFKRGATFGFSLSYNI